MDQKYLDIAKFILIIAVVCALGIFIFMKYIDWKYKVELLSQPCDLCRTLNQKQSDCIGECFITRHFIEGSFQPNGYETEEILKNINVSF